MTRRFLLSLPFVATAARAFGYRDPSVSVALPATHGRVAPIDEGWRSVVIETRSGRRYLSCGCAADSTTHNSWYCPLNPNCPTGATVAMQEALRAGDVECWNTAMRNYRKTAGCSCPVWAADITDEMVARNRGRG